MIVERIHHVAYRCRDAKETMEFYRDVLEMDFRPRHFRGSGSVHQGAEPLYAHLHGCRAGQCPGILRGARPGRRWDGTRILRIWVQHIAFKVKDMETPPAGPREAHRPWDRCTRANGSWHLPVDLLLRSEWTPHRTGLRHRYAGSTRQAPRCGARHDRRMVEEQAHRSARCVAAREGVFRVTARVDGHADQRMTTGTGLNATHDPALRSWVESANWIDCDFPLQNLPYSVFRVLGSSEAHRIGVGIGDQILDVSAAHECGLLPPETHEAAGCMPRRFVEPHDGAGRAIVDAIARCSFDTPLQPGTTRAATA